MAARRRSAARSSRLGGLLAAVLVVALAVCAGLLSLAGWYTLALLPVLGLALVLGAASATGPVRRALWVATFVVPLGYFGWRAQTVRLPAGWIVCANADCSARGPWWSRLVPEEPALDVGFMLSSWLKMTTTEEALSYRADFDAPLDQVGDTSNLVLLRSDERTVYAVVVAPPGKEPLPCVVFLHGFGGLSSAYVQALRSSPVGEKAVIVAPALGVSARWDEPRGEAVLKATLASLPARVDRSRVVLVGMSNGAIFGAQYADQFSGAVLISGIGELPRGPAFVVTGADDVRVPVSVVRDGVGELKKAGVEVTLDVVPKADHGLMFTNVEAWSSRVVSLLDAPRSP